MTKKTKIAIAAGVLCLVVCLCIVAVSCSGPKDAEQPTVPQTGESVTYTIRVKTEGGAALSGVGIYVYTDATMQELVWFQKTNDAGQMSFTDAPSDSYIAVLRDIPEGYIAEETYLLTGETTEIVLGAELTAGDLASITYELGDVVFDFSVTAPDGTVYTLSELLEVKEAVVLNFWYLECQPCRSEFPYLQEAYEKYSGKIEVLAMNPVNTDDEAIAAFKEEYGLTFPVVQCDPAWANAMQLTAYPTTVVIDRYGTIGLIHKGSVTEAETFENMFAFFSAGGYEQTVVEDVEELEDAAQLAQIGSPDAPVEIGGVTSFTVTVGPGQIAYYNVYKLKNVYMQIRSDNAYVIYKDVTYNSKNGVVGLSVTTPDTYTPAYIRIGNAGDEVETFTVNFSVGKGTINNPYSASLGEFTTNVSAGNDQGVYYTYTAAEEGYLTIQCLNVTAGVDYNYTLYNLNSYAQRVMSEDGSTDKETGNRTVSVKVKKGQTVQIIIGTLPTSSNTYPAGNFTSLLSFSTELEEEAEEEVVLTTYAVTVTDENRKPVSGVFLDMTVGNNKVTMKTDENGLAYTKQEAGTYKVTLRVPNGFTAYTTEYQLTETTPAVSVKLDTIITETAVYTVKVVDQNGDPIPGAVVRIGSDYAITDASGTVSLTLVKGNYEAVVSVPSGYTLSGSTVPFGSGTALTVVAQMETSDGDSESTEPTDPNAPTEPDVTTVEYSVRVIDYSGNYLTGVLVQIGDTMTVTNSNGLAVVTLEQGSYPVALAFSDGVSRYYNAVTLTADAPSANIAVAAGVSGDPEKLYVGDAYEVGVGGTYVKLQSNATNYFTFSPTQAGLYKFTTSDPSAEISYWGGNTFYITDQTDSLDDYENNAFTINIKEANIGMTVILGVTGADECVLQIIRLGNPILDETDIKAEVYKGSGDPSTFNLTLSSGQKLTYVDVSGATSDYKLVKGSDGYYHLNSATGPTMYMNLGPNAPYVSMYNMLGFTGFGGTSLTQAFYDEDGKVIRKEDYTELMEKYVTCIKDSTYGVYPLTDDLIYMMQQGGDYKGWWDSTSGQYMFSGISNLNVEIAWMFACCYVS